MVLTLDLSVIPIQANGEMDRHGTSLPPCDRPLQNRVSSWAERFNAGVSANCECKVLSDGKSIVQKRDATNQLALSFKENIVGALDSYNVNVEMGYSHVKSKFLLHLFPGAVC